MEWKEDGGVEWVVRDENRRGVPGFFVQKLAGTFLTFRISAEAAEIYWMVLIFSHKNLLPFSSCLLAERERLKWSSKAGPAFSAS